MLIEVLFRFCPSIFSFLPVSRDRSVSVPEPWLPCYLFKEGQMLGWSMMIHDPQVLLPKIPQDPMEISMEILWGSQISQRPYRNAFCLNLIIATTLKRLSAVAFVIIGIVKVFVGWNRGTGAGSSEQIGRAMTWINGDVWSAYVHICTITAFQHVIYLYNCIHIQMTLWYCMRIMYIMYECTHVYLPPEWYKIM